MRYRFLLAAAVGSLSAVCSLVPAFIVWRIALDLLGPGAHGANILPLSFAAIAGLEGRLIFLGISRMLARATSVSTCDALRLAVAKKLTTVPLGFLAARHSGELESLVVDDIDVLGSFLGERVHEAIAALVAPATAIILLVFVDWRLALLAATAVGLAVGFSAMLQRDAATMTARESTLANLDAAGLEYLRGMAVLRTNARSPQAADRFVAAISDYRDLEAERARTVAPGIASLRVATAAGLIAVLPFGLELLRQGLVGLPALLLFVVVEFSLSGILQRLSGLAVPLRAALESAARLAAVLEAPATTEPAEPALIDLTDDSLEFDNVWFSYGDGGRHSAGPVLRGVSLRAESRKVTALVGPSGAGKTTLTRLVARFWDVDAGRVLVGGIDVRDHAVAALMDRMAFVFQDVYMLDDTVYANISMGRKDVTEEQVVAAATDAGAHDFIAALPEGYRTVVGERGARLSRGERQRLQIARALLKDAPILILDEATAATDPATELAIQQALARLAHGKTVLVVAHRMSTIAEADAIVVLERDGSIAGTGRHDELLASCELYRTLWEDHLASVAWTVPVPVVADAAAGPLAVRA